MQDNTDKWDGLLDEGTPDTIPTPKKTPKPPRPRRDYNWTRILLTVATIVLVVTLLWWWNHQDSPDAVKPDATPSPTRTQLLVEPWSYDTEVSVVATNAAKTAIYDTATVLLTNRYEAGQLIDWWTIDERLEGHADNMLRYELVEYPEMQTAGLEPAETITTIHFNEAADAEVGRWAGTITVALTGPHGEREITVNVTAKAVSEGWHVTRWDVES